MDWKKTGGQAFPTSDGQAAHAIAAAASSGIEDSADRDRVYTEVRGQTMQGMTLRDYFAAHAPAAPDDFGWAPGECDSWQRNARWAYVYADAMLAARSAA